MDKNRCKKKHIRFSKPLKTLPMLEMKWFVKLREVKIHTSFLVKFFLVATIRQKMLKIISVNIDCKVSNFKRRQQPNGSYWVSKDVFFSKLLSSGDWKCFFIVKDCQDIAVQPLLVDNFFDVKAATALYRSCFCHCNGIVHILGHSNSCLNWF